MLNPGIKTDSQLKEAIIRVIVFFDLFSYPLSAYEIFKYLDKKIALSDIMADIVNISEIDQKDGFFFLAGRNEIIITRGERHNYSLRKIKIARRFARFFSLLPFIKLIALSNSIGQYNLRDGSDIDFFVICTPKRIWLTRLYCAGIAKMLNCRPTVKNKRDKICLSFYLTTEHLNLADLKLDGDDPYFFYWQRSLVLLYSKDRTYENFLIANGLPTLVTETELNSKITATVASRSNSILNFLETVAKKIQLKIMPPVLKQAMNNSTGVVISDQVLKLYLRDNRREYAQKYGDKIYQIFTQNN